MSMVTQGGDSSEELTREQERDLVERAQAGDQRALERLLAAHQDRTYRTALRFLGGREEEAFELAQEVLISAFRHIHQFRAESKFSTWLYRITSNLAKNRFVVENREKARYTSLEAPAGNDEDAEPRQWEAGGVDARTLASDREAVKLMQERMATLDPEWQQVLTLRFFEELSYEEISEALEVPIGTVKSRINRARKALREAMADWLEERRTV
ncbi:MAG: sigma-70 family RNA polymerase sigma factor [Sumerlaeia bacterium]